MELEGGGQIVIDGNYAYVGHQHRPHGTTILDIADPRKPKVLSTLKPGHPWSHSHKARVVGDVMVDRFIEGRVTRISPEAPVPVVRVEEEWRAPGGAANVAANVTALGAGCDLIGCIGDDAAGASLVDELERQGIGGSGLVRTAGRPTR